jgi:hypothetical protein
MVDFRACHDNKSVVWSAQAKTARTCGRTIKIKSFCAFKKWLYYLELHLFVKMYGQVKEENGEVIKIHSGSYKKQ